MVKKLVRGNVVEMGTQEEQEFRRDGWAEEHTPAQLAALKVQHEAEVDRLADAARRRFVTPGLTQQAVYQLKAAEARAISNDAAPEPARYPLLAASVGIDVPASGSSASDMKAVAAIVLARHDAWLTAAGAIEAVRLRAKTDIQGLADPTDRNAVEAILNGLEWPKPEKEKS